MADASKVFILLNPWSQSVPDDDLREIFYGAAAEAQAQIETWRASGELPDGSDGSFAAVVLDPTNPRGRSDHPADRVMAVVLFGPNAMGFVPNGLAKADAHDRHGVPNGKLIAEDNHRLADSDFAWGNSVEYRGAVGGGSGLSKDQDGEVAQTILERVIDDVAELREAWLAEQRTSPNGHGWYNTANEPGPEYRYLVTRLS
jgi:hypothetical protein